MYPGNLVAVDAASQVKVNPHHMAVCLETLAIHCIVHLNDDTSYVSLKLQKTKCSSGRPRVSNLLSHKSRIYSWYSGAPGFCRKSCFSVQVRFM